MACGVCGEVCTRRVFIICVRIFGSLCGCAIIVLAILDFVNQVTDAKTIVNDIYRLIFGFLIILAELRFDRVLRRFFQFLIYSIGLGAFYMFVGGLALTSEPLQITIACIFCFVGMIYCAFGCCCTGMDGSERMTENEETAKAKASQQNAADTAV